MATPVHGHELLEQVLGYHKPKDERVVNMIEKIRTHFLNFGHFLIEETPGGPDMTIAIRKLHDAQQAFIYNLVAHQDEYLTSLDND